MSLYDDLGGAPAVQAALARFYEQVLSDDELARYFQGVDIEGLQARQARFFAMALGGPDEYTGPGLRASHARARALGMDDGVVDRFLGYFRSTLGEFGVPPAKIDEVMGIAEGGRAEVLNRS